MEWIKLKTENDTLPELKDGGVLIHFENGSIETVHIEDWFSDITAGLGDNGEQLYSKWYLSTEATHWMALPEPPN